MKPLETLLLCGLLSQGVLFIVDEFYFHRRRTLPLWERRGHPIDSFVLLCAVALTLLDPVRPWTLLFLGAAVFSSLLVTKDEWVHAHYCSEAEHWVHSLLFMLHPLNLFIIGITWAQWVPGTFPRTLVIVYAASIFSLFIYQLIYWKAIPHGNQ